MIVPGILVCSSFLISVCMYVYCVESFAHIECYNDCSLLCMTLQLLRGGIWAPLSMFSRNRFGCCCYFLVDVMEAFSVCVEVLCWIDHVGYSNQCACCACAPRIHQSVPSISFVYVFVCRKLSPHLRV